MVENSRGTTIGTIKTIEEITDQRYSQSKAPTVIRIANQKDLKFQALTDKLEDEALFYCLNKIRSREMQMKIIKVTYMLHHSKIIFYFTADGRVDFRSLVKDLASRFHSRIEMRQIGVRDEAQIIGGMGVCGRELCCHSFLGDFQPVSLENARQNSLGVANDKLIGVCGRFMCCLRFEEPEPQNENLKEDKQNRNKRDAIPQMGRKKPDANKQGQIRRGKTQVEKAVENAAAQKATEQANTKQDQPEKKEQQPKNKQNKNRRRRGYQQGNDQKTGQNPPRKKRPPKRKPTNPKPKPTEPKKKE